MSKASERRMNYHKTVIQSMSLEVICDEIVRRGLKVQIFAGSELLPGKQ